MKKPQIDNFNVDFEKFVLSAMLIKDGEIIPTVSQILNAEDFYRPEHRLIFNAILDTYKKYSDHLELHLCTEELEKKKILQSPQTPNAPVDLDYFFSILEASGHTNAYATFHAGIIKEYAEKRQLLDDMRVVAERIKSDFAANIEDLQADVVNLALKINAKKNQSKFSNLQEYLTTEINADIDKAALSQDRKTGFSNLDDKQKFLPGVYILGAEPGLGKTTFAWQLAEQLAENGEHCIFCSYEMSKFEMAAKSLARRAFLYNPDSTLTAADIRNGGFSDAVARARYDLITNDDAKNLELLEISEEVSIDKLLALIYPICKKEDRPPIVFIDYLQIAVNSGADSRDDLKSRIDSALRKLKVFQRDTGVTFILISSFNRTNYNQNAAFQSFKESGGIEYSADVIWALQLFAVQNLKDAAGVQKIREVINDAKKQFPRQMVLNCLKNRFGSNYNCYFEYYSKFDFFKPCHKDDFEEIDGPPEPNNSNTKNKLDIV